ncbi:carbohydrate-binding protein [Winslowiella iniecta]|nr:carbohydrate-binding protein [Winslowiella iniecta]
MVHYQADQVVMFEGKKDRCLQSHPSVVHWSPKDVQALWQQPDQ